MCFQPKCINAPPVPQNAPRGTIGGLVDRLEQMREKFNLANVFKALENLPPDPGPYARAIQACGKSKALIEGKRVHDLIKRVGLEDNIILCNHTVRMYACCGSISDAQDTFNRMPQRNTVSWNALISAYALEGHSSRCFQLFIHMQHDGMKPSRITFILLLGVRESLASSEYLHFCLQESRIELDVIVSTALLTMYSYSGNHARAREVFDRMENRNTVSWTAMLTAYAKSGQSVEAASLYNLMLQQGDKGDVVTFIAVLTSCKEFRHLLLFHSCISEIALEQNTNIGNALINAYGGCGEVQLAMKMFEKMARRNVVSWTALIAAHSQNGENKKALLIFLQMLLEGVRPDQVTVFQMLEVCGRINSLPEGEMILACSIEFGVDLRGVFGNAVVSMFGKCGSLSDAERVFHQLRKQDRVSWTALITAHAQHGRCDQSLELFRVMKQSGVDTDNVTYVSVLSVCNHSGRLREGCEMFYSMVSDDGLVPEVEHCGCVVGLLSRAGWVEEAEEFIRRMSSSCSSNAGIWNSLLAACGLHGDADGGKRAAQKLLGLDSHHASAYVHLSNITESRAALSDE